MPGSQKAQGSQASLRTEADKKPDRLPWKPNNASKSLLGSAGRTGASNGCDTVARDYTKSKPWRKIYTPSPPCNTAWVAIHPKNGDIYVSEKSNNKVTILRKQDDGYSIGHIKCGDSLSPEGIAFVTDSAHVYLLISDEASKQALMLNSNGELVMAMDGREEFQQLSGIAGSFNPTLIYVNNSDTRYNHGSQVEMFNMGGQAIGFGITGQGPVKDLNLGSTFQGICTTENSVFVSDITNHVVYKMDSEGRRLVKEIGTRKAGKQASEFESPSGICTDQRGNLIVCDRGNKRLQIFSSSGDFLSEIKTEGCPFDVDVMLDGTLLVSQSEEGGCNAFISTY